LKLAGMSNVKVTLGATRGSEFSHTKRKTLAEKMEIAFDI